MKPRGRRHRRHRRPMRTGCTLHCQARVYAEVAHGHDDGEEEGVASYVRANEVCRKFEWPLVDSSFGPCRSAVDPTASRRGRLLAHGMRLVWPSLRWLRWTPCRARRDWYVRMEGGNRHSSLTRSLTRSLAPRACAGQPEDRHGESHQFCRGEPQPAVRNLSCQRPTTDSTCGPPHTSSSRSHSPPRRLAASLPHPHRFIFLTPQNLDTLVSARDHCRANGVELPDDFIKVVSMKPPRG